jgi:hypothetical protein
MLKDESSLRNDRVTLLLFLIVASALVTFSNPPSAPSAANSPAVGSLRVIKTIPGVSVNDEISVLLTIQNNGTVPVFDLQIYEYMNSNLNVRGSIVVQGPSTRSTVSVGSGGLVSINQVIVDPPPPNTLMPGEKMTLSYTQVAPKAGDFQIPTSLVWFSYIYVGSTIRLSLYSNGQLVHVLNDYEKATLQIYPYVLAGATFSSTITILLWTRKKLGKLKRGITR